ncbi:MAG TPA: acyl carrier protein [Polyangiales bacterium]|nr:acyl carrier protein [Polyangiales bacterium]
MTDKAKRRIADFIRECLYAHSDEDELREDESLFLSGRLDSLSVTRLVVFLEETFSVDFANHPFDVAELDSVSQIVEFAEQHGAAA